MGRLVIDVSVRGVALSPKLPGIITIVLRASTELRVNKFLEPAPKKSKINTRKMNCTVMLNNFKT